MKAITLKEYGPADSLKVTDIPVPQISDDQVLVQVHAASLNHVDNLKVTGVLKDFFPLSFPWIPGSDFAGVITAVGRNVKDRSVGEEVLGYTPSGAFADYVAASPALLVPKPASLPFTAAAAIPVAAQTAWQALFTHAKLKEGQSVLIHGAAGAIGAYAVQLAHQAGANVIATARGKDQDYVKGLGADNVIDYTTSRFETLTGKVDVVLDTVGGEVQQRSLGILKEGGFLVAFNQPVEENEAERHKIKAIFMHLVADAATLKTVTDRINEGKLKVDVARVYPLEQAGQALTDLTRNLPGLHRSAAQQQVDKKHGKLVLQLI